MLHNYGASSITIQRVHSPDIMCTHASGIAIITVCMVPIGIIMPVLSISTQCYAKGQQDISNNTARAIHRYDCGRESPYLTL